LTVDTTQAACAGQWQCVVLDSIEYSGARETVRVRRTCRDDHARGRGRLRRRRRVALAEWPAGQLHLHLHGDAVPTTACRPQRQSSPRDPTQTEFLQLGPPVSRGNCYRHATKAQVALGSWGCHMPKSAIRQQWGSV